MRRQIARRATTSVSLFPFLAVLICTMGALIVLLVLVVQMARVQADTISDDRQRVAEEQLAERQKLLQEQEDFDWQREILEQQRGELTGRLADHRSELSHLEDHIRRLERKVQQLQAEARDLSQVGQSDQQSAEAVAARWQALQSEIDAERERLRRAREEAAERKQSFAIIPYQGPNGTQRRPIYIECTRTGIIIQPEGVVLGPEDFSGPLGPGNPLDAALRTISEHWQRVSGSATAGRPYPLLIVRSSGPIAYSMARAAMVSWEDEFGYELIEDDTELTFPAPDPDLKRMLEATVQTARHRQALLAAAMPSRFSGSAPREFSVEDSSEYRGSGAGGGYGSTNGTGGGSGTDNGTGNGYGASSAVATRGGTAAAGTVGAAGSGSSVGVQSAGDAAAGSRTSRSAEGSPAGFAAGGTSRGTGVAGSVPQSTGDAVGGFYSNAYGSGAADSTGSTDRVAASAGADGGPGGRFGAGSTPGGSTEPRNSAGGQPAGGQPAGVSGGAAGMSAMSSPPGASAAGPSGSASLQAGAASSQGASGSPSAAAGATSCNTAGSGGATQSLAGARGQNWALPYATPTATGITRPILAECHPDRIILRADRRSGFASQVVAFNGPAENAIDQVVAGIHQHVQRWGMAVTGGYWKPVLRFEVFPQADGRFWELKTLLEGSGIVVEQR
jgi:hypothetical protein